MPDVTEIYPADDCIRTRHTMDFGDRSTNAGAYLLMSALEAAGLDEMVDPATEQSAASFINSRAPSGVNGAVGHCGRAIGRGACGQWQLDHESLQIIPKSVQA